MRVWNSQLEAEDLGDEAAAFCSDFLQEEVRLVYMDSGCVRTIAQEGFQERQVSFADGYPLLITTLESLEALNQKLEEPVPMNRFRPNIVLEGATPWEEHRWKKLMIGDLELTLAKACTRCAMITIEQETGLRRSSEPLRQLFQEPGLEGKAVFGENAVHAAPGVLRVGQEVTVLG